LCGLVLGHGEQQRRKLKKHLALHLSRKYHGTKNPVSGENVFNSNSPPAITTRKTARRTNKLPTIKKGPKSRVKSKPTKQKIIPSLPEIKIEPPVIETIFLVPEIDDGRNWVCHHEFCESKFYTDEELKNHLYETHDKM
jgi:hypothetical protein